MSDRLRILCFGGPLNEQVVPCRSDDPVLLAPIPERVSYSLAEMAEPMAPMFRTARYDIKKVGVELDGRPYVWRVGVVQGFPEHRITDTMNVVLAMCRWPLAAWLQVEPRRAASPATHVLGEDCDICAGRGFDYLGRRCRRWA